MDTITLEVKQVLNCWKIATKCSISQKTLSLSSNGFFWSVMLRIRLKVLLACCIRAESHKRKKNNCVFYAVFHALMQFGNFYIALGPSALRQTANQCPAIQTANQCPAILLLARPGDGSFMYVVPYTMVLSPDFIYVVPYTMVLSPDYWTVQVLAP